MSEELKSKLTPAQKFVMDKFEQNKNFDCCIHKHRHSEAWFQIESRSWHKISDQTIKALERKRLIYKQDNTRWRLTPPNQ